MPSKKERLKRVKPKKIEWDKIPAPEEILEEMKKAEIDPILPSQRRKGPCGGCDVVMDFIRRPPIK